MTQHRSKAKGGARSGVWLFATVFFAGILMGGLGGWFAAGPRGWRPPGGRSPAMLAEQPVVRIGSEREPADGRWENGESTIGPVGIEGMDGFGPLASRPPDRNAKDRVGDGPCSLPVAVGVVGGCLLGAGAMAWASRRAVARLEARARHFEELAARRRPQEDWLADLDRNLEGEWEDRR